MKIIIEKIVVILEGILNDFTMLNATSINIIDEIIPMIIQGDNLFFLKKLETEKNLVITKDDIQKHNKKNNE